MKILFVIDALGVGGGAEHSLAAMLPLLRGRGVECSVACLFPRQGGLQAQLQEQGFQVEVLAATSWFGRIQALRRKVTAESPDIVHATLFNSCLVARLACIRLRVARVDSLVNTSYDPVRIERLGIPRWKMRAVRWTDSITARYLGGHFHAVTPTVAKEAVEILSINQERVTVVRRGRSLDSLGEPSQARRERTRQRLGITEGAPVFLNVGRQDGSKGQADLIRAFGKLLDTHGDAILLVAGREGDASPEIESAFEQVGAGPDSIQILGHRTDVFDLYVAADVFVLPSLYEGAAGSLLEAMALGIPIIGSDAPSVAEVLGWGEYGKIVPRGDVVALAEAMAELLSDPQRRLMLAEAARRHFLEYYELDRVVDAMVEMYQHVLPRSESGR